MSIASMFRRVSITSCLCLLLPTAVKAQPIEWPVSEGGNGWPGHLATITSAAENAWITTT